MNSSNIPEISAQECLALLAANTCTVIDVREAHERLRGYIEQAHHIPRSQLVDRIAELTSDYSAHIICQCASGVRSAMCARTLRELGYANVASLQGGIDAWEAANLPLCIPDSTFSDDEQSRYARHFSVPEIGTKGQTALRNAHVCMVGAGGLGSPAAYYLAAAGIGHLTIIDADTVELSNLQRQILHSSDRVGQAKVASAHTTLRALNPDCEVTAIQDRVTAENAEQHFRNADIVIDGSDNFATRYIVNDACLSLGKPFIFGSVFRFEGQTSLFHPSQGPCYRCLYPAAPPPELAPSCAEAGVVGVIPGIVGCLQANEAIKYLVGIGDTLQGRLLCINALTMQFREMKIQKDPTCRCNTTTK